MTYQPRIGDYGVVRSSGLAARLIQIGTVSRWNHSIVYIGGDYIVEANPTGVEISNLSRYDKIAWNQHEQLTDTQRDTIAKYAIDQVGKAYSFITIALIFFRILGLKFLSTRLAVTLAKHEGYICSELVAECYSKAGFPLSTKPDWQVVPGDLAERLIWQ